MKTKSILSFTWILIFLFCLSGPVNSAPLTSLSRLPAPDVARVQPPRVQDLGRVVLPSAQPAFDSKKPEENPGAYPT